MEQLFTGIFENTASVGVVAFMSCVLVSLVIGAYLALMYRKTYCGSESFVITLGILPAIVCVVIMMVNGNVGAGVAVAGAFSLVRFRSVPGTAREISMLFCAMATGLMTGMGYLGYAILWTIIMSVVVLVWNLASDSGEQDGCRKILKITVPEDLNYEGIFEEVLSGYASAYELMSVKTTNMGSLFKLTYQIVLKDTASEKALMDELRCRNGNLEIGIMRQEGTDVAL